jgi:hypothetical protein
MIRPFQTAVVVSLLALAGCATPSQQCQSDAAAPYRAALREQARVVQDLERGFTYKTQFEEVRRWRSCGAPFGPPYPCRDTNADTVTRKVPVDRVALGQRRDALAQSLPGLRRQAEADTLQCRALYPEPQEAG